MRSRLLLLVLGLSAVSGLLLYLMRQFPAPLSTAAQSCVGSCAPALCRALHPGAPADPTSAAPAISVEVDAGTRPDLDAADAGEPQGDRVAPDLPPLPPAPAPRRAPVSAPGRVAAGDTFVSTARRLLQEGQRALARKQPTYAIRLCLRAADLQTQDRGAALTCAGRGYYLLGGWHERARALALQALQQPLYPPEAHLLLGDARRALNDCRGARTAYLQLLDDQPEHREACAGLRACQGNPRPGTCGTPPAPDAGAAPARPAS
jgi:tetratricopeptide (TPR) repeat protein